MAMGAYSGTFIEESPGKSKVVPDPQGRILVLPYLHKGKQVNYKARWYGQEGRRFSQDPDGKKVLYNADCLTDPAIQFDLETGHDALIWTEGEFDLWAGQECGYRAIVSVPDGAPKHTDKDGNPLPPVPGNAKDIDFENDLKYAFLRTHWSDLEGVKVNILATDNDGQGQRLAAELARRLGPARCKFVTYPDDVVVPDKDDDGNRIMRRCKDLNEVKLYLGEAAVQHMIENAKDWPIKGLYRLEDYPEREQPTTYKIGISPEFDAHLSAFKPSFWAVTGIPGFGKSKLVNLMAMKMAMNHNWRTLMFSGEADIAQIISYELMTFYLGKPRSQWTQAERKRAKEFVNWYFVFIDHNLEDDINDLDLSQTIEHIEEAKVRFEIDNVILDPWNELEHKRDRHMSQTEYVGDAIRQLKRTARHYELMMTVVAHPKKVEGMPQLYDISDSAHWANKSDVGVVIHAENDLSTIRQIYVPKQKFKFAGKKGVFELDFVPELEMFVPYKTLAQQGGDTPF